MEIYYACAQFFRKEYYAAFNLLLQNTEHVNSGNESGYNKIKISEGIRIVMYPSPTKVALALYRAPAILAFNLQLNNNENVYLSV